MVSGNLAIHSLEAKTVSLKNVFPTESQTLLLLSVIIEFDNVSLDSVIISLTSLNFVSSTIFDF